ncbi:YbaB/EbfC family nucleoid-associated protein [Paracoccaceae bacterium GXU_MW_L88]
MFKGLGGIGDMAKMMGKVGEVQEKMAKVQEDLKDLEITGEAGAGMVVATVNGKGKVKGLTLDPALFENDKEVAEDLIVQAFSEAQKAASARAKEEIQKVTDDLGLPPGMKLPF